MTTSSKASSSKGDSPSESQSEQVAPISPLAFLPGFVARRPAAAAAMGEIEGIRKEKKLPSLNTTDYRFSVGRPGGIPFSLPVEVLYKPESPEEVNLGTFRVKL